MTKEEALREVQAASAVVNMAAQASAEAYEIRAEAIRKAWHTGAHVSEIARAAGITHVPVLRIIKKEP